jgi:hypothetical protein
MAGLWSFGTFVSYWLHRTNHTVVLLHTFAAGLVRNCGFANSTTPDIISAHPMGVGHH